MAWEEIERPVNSTYDPDVVLIKTNNRRLGKASKTQYRVVVYIGSVLLKQLLWTRSSSVKFAWGTGEHQGKLRILPMKNPSRGGWVVRMVASGTGIISNGILPDHLNQIDRSLPVMHSIGVIEGSIVEHYLELELPADFYLGTTSIANLGTTSTDDVGDSLSVLPETPPLAQPPPVIKSMSTPQPEIKPVPVVEKKPPPISTDSFPQPQENTLVDISYICQYIRTHVGDDASPVSARTIRLNNTEVVHTEALKIANKHRQDAKLAPFQLRPIS